MSKDKKVNKKTAVIQPGIYIPIINKSGDVELVQASKVYPVFKPKYL